MSDERSVFDIPGAHLPVHPDWVMAAKAVRVTVPVKVLYDRKALNKVTDEVLGRLGCLGCHSGFDIRFLLEQDYSVNEKLEVSPVQRVF
jgi:hypothetical protein